MKTRLQRRKHRSSRYLDPSGEQGVFEESAFRFILRRERSRADRTQGQFSIVLLSPCDSDDAPLEKIINAIAKQMRITDSIGWISSSSICILLQDTPREGAICFWQRIHEALDPIWPAADMKIQTYPDEEGPQCALRNSLESDDAPPPSEIINQQRPPAGFIGNSDGPSTMSSEKFLNELLAIRPSILHRLFDCLAAGTAIVILSPLILLIMLGIRISSPGPMHYTQVRIGHKSRFFHCLKFRTMHHHSETALHENYLTYLIHHEVPMQKLDQGGDDRVFPLGRLLRRTSLDELPQLLNVIKGDMSLIGPRPGTPNEYREYLQWHRHRVDIPPGLSGLWQVSGKNRTTFTEMMRLDLRYIRRHSFWMDLQIMLKTPPVIVLMFLEHYSASHEDTRQATAARQPIPQTANKARQRTMD